MVALVRLMDDPLGSAGESPHYVEVHRSNQDVFHDNQEKMHDRRDVWLQ
jgi:hypothetical protein